LKGKFDEDLRTWCKAAAQVKYPILSEFGTEMNGEWFPWNGIWNGGGKTTGYGDPGLADGPERFRDAYRHIITVCLGSGARNITWVFHVNGVDQPDDDWNRFENYYPGDDYIGWLALSQYGALTPTQEERIDFGPAFEQVYSRLTRLSPEKPVIVAEFGSTANAVSVDQAVWAESALQVIKEKAGKPNSRLVGFSWWNEGWQNDDNADHDTNMRVQDNKPLSDVFMNEVAKDSRVLGRITFEP
jgi:beta-mannanase